MIAKLKSNETMKKVLKFYDSYYYPMVIFLVVLLTHVLALDILGIAIVFLSAVFSNVFCDDLRSSLPVVFMGPLVVSTQNSPGYGWSNYYEEPFVIISLVVICLAVAISIIFRVVYYKEYKNLFTKRFLLLGFLIFGVCFLCSGLFSKYYDFDNLIVVIMCLISQPLGYLLYSVSLKHREDNMEYLAKVSVWTIILIVLELIFTYILNYKIGMPLDSAWKDLIILGMLVSNSAGIFMAMLLPFCFYLCCTQKRGYLYYLLSILVMGAIYFTLSRNALLFSTPLFLLGNIIVCFLGKNKKPCRIILGAICLCGIALLALLIYKGVMAKLLTYFIDAGFNDRQRFGIWKEFLSYFTEYPIFGGGFSAYFNNHKEKLVVIYRSLSHNTIIQIIGSMGIVGILGYLFHRVEIVRMFIKRMNFNKFIILLSVLTYLLCGLLDQVYFLPNFAIVYTICLTFAEKQTINELKTQNKNLKESLNNEEA